MPFAQLPDTRLFYDSAGEGGSPVLLIMGFGVPGHLWRNQIDHFKPQHRVAWFDNAGVGETRRSRWRPPNMADLARHAVGVMDALKWPDAHVVGVSMGGMIAQEVALSHRSRVRSLSLLVTHAGGLRNVLPTGRALGLFLLGFLGPRARRAERLERLIYPEAFRHLLDRESLRRALEDEVISAAGVLDRLHQLAAILSHRSHRRLSTLAKLPTLVVKAGQDVLVRPSACHRLHRAIPNSRLLEFADAGHAVMHQCATELNRALAAHFARADGA